MSLKSRIRAHVDRSMARTEKWNQEQLGIFITMVATLFAPFRVIIGYCVGYATGFVRRGINKRPGGCPFPLWAPKRTSGLGESHGPY